MDYQTPEGWTSIHSSPILDTPKSSENKNPANSIGQPQLAEGEMVIEDGEVKNRQYFIVQCPDAKLKAIVPGAKDNQDYVGSPKRTRQEALQDAFNILNTALPTDYLGSASVRTPDKVYSTNN
jgi:hypothetical protein